MEDNKDLLKITKLPNDFREHLVLTGVMEKDIKTNIDYRHYDFFYSSTPLQLMEKQKTYKFKKLTGLNKYTIANFRYVATLTSTDLLMCFDDDICMLLNKVGNEFSNTPSLADLQDYVDKENNEIKQEVVRRWQQDLFNF